MKKVLVIALVALLSVSALFAADYKGASKKDSFGIGLNAGTNSGVIVNYGMGKFDLEGIVGFGVLNGTGLDIEVAANYLIVDVAKEAKIDGKMPFTVGAEVGLLMGFKNSFSLRINVLAPLKLSYTFPKFPMSIYFRVAPGVGIPVVNGGTVGFAIESAIGATYNF